MTNNFTEQQLWDAFRYISGDCSSEESIVFESRLAEDPVLRECVVEAVQLSAALVGEPMPAVPVVQSRRSKKSRFQFVATAVVGLVCGVLLMVVWKTPAANEVVQKLNASDDIELADAELMLSFWSSEREEAAPDGGESVASVDDDLELVAELDVPDWLVAAVTLSEMNEFPELDDVIPSSDLPDDVELF